MGMLPGLSGFPDLKGVETSLSEGMGALKSMASSLDRLADAAVEYLEQQKEK